MTNPVKDANVNVIYMDAYLVVAPENEKMMATIEAAGRVCYKSEDRVVSDGSSAATFIRGIIQRGHESVLEHGSVTAKVIADRGVTHEVVRHRIAAYSQESTRYCNYGNDKFGNCITVAQPTFWNWKNEKHHDMLTEWVKAMEDANAHYLKLLALGATPQEARSVLPQSTKAELFMTMNIREWRHFFKLRCSAAAHPDIRHVAFKLLDQMYRRYPVLFEDLYKEFYAPEPTTGSC